MIFAALLSPTVILKLHLIYKRFHNVVITTQHYTVSYFPTGSRLLIHILKIGFTFCDTIAQQRGFADIIPEDACLSSLEKKTGDQEETLIITLEENDTKKRINVSRPGYNLKKYSFSDCETLGANLITESIIEYAFSSNYVLKTEDILEYHSRDFFAKPGKYIDAGNRPAKS